MVVVLGQAQDGISQWQQGARGLAVVGTTSDTHGKLHGLRPPGVVQPTRRSLAEHGVARRAPQDTGKIS